MKITKREKEVIKKLSEGLTTKEVARDLFLSPYTVESHKKNIFDKMQARTLLQLGAMAVRHGIIVVLFLSTIVSSWSQSQFEIEGTIKATGLAGEGERMLMADENGLLKVTQNDPSVLELKDSTGDVRFRFDANLGLFQMLVDGDTIREKQVIPFPQQDEINAKSSIAKAFSEESIETLVYDEIMPLINSIQSKLTGTDIPLPPVLNENQRPLNFEFGMENGENTFFFDRGLEEIGVLRYNGTINSNGFIEKIEVASNFPNTADWILKFENDMLIEIEYREFGSLTESKRRKKTFNDKCEELTCESVDSMHKETVTNKMSNSFTSNDGQNLGIFSLLNPDFVNSWFGFGPNGVPNGGAGNLNNQFGFTPEYSNIFKQDGNTAQQVMSDVNGIQAVKDHDISNSEDTPQFLSFFFDFPNNRILVCGDVHVKGNVTATGSITPSQSFKAEITKSNKNLFSERVGSGNVTTDINGEAVVSLPSSISKNFYDFRYQLTPIGSFSQAIIGEELSNGHFIIMTTDPNVKVSWQISGIATKSFLKSLDTQNQIDTDEVRLPKRIKSPSSIEYNY